MLTRVGNAALRGLLTALLVATPSLLLPTVSPDTAQIVALIGLALALLVTVEYAAVYPSLVEFRDAPPFNRIRFLGLFVTVFVLSLITHGMGEQSGVSVFVTALGQYVGYVLDFPFSPVRLVLASLPDTASAAQVALVRAGAGLAFLSAIISLSVFYLVVKLYDWPRSMGAFNVWINLPTFDPTTGGDVVTRLRWDARMNLIIGIALPFAGPLVAGTGMTLFAGGGSIGLEQTTIWLVAAWAFLPLSLFMRAIAMARVADMIAEKRRRSTEAPETATALA